MLVFPSQRGQKTVVKNPDDSITDGWVRWDSDGPILTLPNDQEVHNESGYCYRVYEKIVLDQLGMSVKVKLDSPVMLQLKSDYFVKRTYAPGITQTDVFIYPPASEGWYGRMVLGTEIYNFYIQSVCKQESSKIEYWLTIFDDKKIYESHPIKYYEVETISLNDDVQNRQEIIWDKIFLNPDEIRASFLSILDGESPPFENILKLVEGTPNIIPTPQGSLGDTVSTLVPKWIDEDTRQEIVLFLSWLASGKFPGEDVINLFEKLILLPTARYLLATHKYRHIMGLPPINYVRTLNAELPETGYHYERDVVLSRVVGKIHPHFLTSIVTDIVDELNQQGIIVTRLPTTHRKVSSFNEDDVRFLMYWGGLRLEVIPNLSVIGLKELVYLGAAHQWPHKHMVWSGFLENQNTRFSSMYFPENVVSQTKATNTRLMEVDLYLRSDNFNLYDADTDMWEFPKNRFLNLSTHSTSVSQLHREFFSNHDKGKERITMREATVLDISQNMPFVSNLETERIQRIYSITNQEFVETLQDLSNRRIINFKYTTVNQTYEGLMITLRGDSEKVLATTRSLLKYTPLSSARIIDRGKTVILLIRLPHYLMNNLLILLSQDDFSDIDILHSSLTKVRAYRNNFFRRLYNPEKGWDDSNESIKSQKRS